MTIETIEVAIGRIKAASPNSPIAVFRSDLKGSVEAVFASTVETQGRIAARDRNLIGIFTELDDLNKVRKILGQCEGLW